MKQLLRFFAVVVVCLLSRGLLSAQESTNGIDPEALIERILAVDRAQRVEIKDVIFEAEYVEGEEKDDKGFVEKVRFEKKIYIKYLEDTSWYHADYLAYYKNGKLQKRKDLEKQADKRKQKQEKRKIFNISYPVLAPFSPEYRDRYEVIYEGVPAEPVESYVCHHFTVVSREEHENSINGEYYFEAATFHLVRVDFTPARLVNKTMFDVKELMMSIVYGPTPDGFWLPRRLDVRGREKTALLLKTEFSWTEYYRNPIFNSGVSDDIFEVKDGE